MFGVLHIISKSKEKIDLNELFEKLIYSSDIDSHFDYIRKCTLSRKECYKQFLEILEPSSSKKNGEVKFRKDYKCSCGRRWLREEFVYFDGWLVDMEYFLEACVLESGKSKTFYYQGAIDYHI